ncbi:probable glycosyltransferase At5g03795, partial [Andrographis paniculata]|uniref:probable glycosyltransferase At5g03795 n=1 Tax=Andrographis paniculata TaxID=175694 RepID=UPI0021E6F31A
TFFGVHSSESHFIKNIRESSFLTRNPRRARVFFTPMPCHHMIRLCFANSPKHLIDESMKISNKKDNTKPRVFYIPYTCKKMDPKSSRFNPIQEPISDPIQEYSFLTFDTFQNSPSFARYGLFEKTNTTSVETPFVICDEFAAKAIEELAVQPQNSVRLVCLQGSKHKLASYIDIPLPAVISPLSDQPENTTRTTLGYWEGVCETYVSKMLVMLWDDDEKLYVNCTENYYDESRAEKLVAALFCICPDAGAKCIAEAIHYGCVPVILGDEYALPLDKVLNWHRFSILLEEKDVYELKRILESKDIAKVQSLQKNLIKVRRHFRWNRAPRMYDAFHMTVYQIWVEEKECRNLEHLMISAIGISSHSKPRSQTTQIFWI